MAKEHIRKNEEAYSNREIDHYFKEIKDLLIEIKTQTTLTNGRVTKIELWRESLTGKMIATGTFLGLIWGLLLKFIP